MERIGVVGGGTMGVGVAFVFAVAGCDTALVEPVAERAERARETIVRQAKRAEEKGKLNAAAVIGKVRLVAATEELPTGLDLIVEAVPERLELKRGVLAEAEAREPAMVASNTSGLSIDELAVGLRRPEAFLGMHFFNPVWVMPLLEIVRGSATAERTVAAALVAAKLIGKEAIVVRDAPGFASSRLGIALGLEAIRMLQDGVASAADIDRAMELGYRHPMGPLRLTDLVGLDVRLDIARHLEASYGSRFSPPCLLIDKVEAGELGRKTGRGFYDWP
jgi:3-hydroxybutyryl-CoA dehydrogenase